MKVNKSYFLKFENIREAFIDDGALVMLAFLLAYISKNSLASSIAFILSFLIFFFTKSVSTRIIINVITIFIVVIGMYRIDLGISNNEISLVLMVYMLCFFMILCFIQVIFITYKIYTYEINNPMITSKKNFCIRFMVKAINFVDRSLYKMGLIVPLFYYIVLTILIISFYASIFSYMNKYYSLNSSTSGFYTSADRIKFEKGLEESIYVSDTPKKGQEGATVIRIPSLKDNDEYRMENGKIISNRKNLNVTANELGERFLISFLSEYNYFSTTTFYTVGYGDVEIRGAVPKLVVQSEMFMAAIFNIIFIPLMLFVIQDYISRSREKAKENNKEGSEKKQEDTLIQALTEVNGKREDGAIIKIVNGIPIYYEKK